MTVIAATTAFHLGAIVRYHGSHASEHYATFYIQAIDGNRLTIADVDYPTSGVLRNVHPGHVTPTGAMLTLCECLHDVERIVPTGCCGAVGCGCDDHGWNVR